MGGLGWVGLACLARTELTGHGTVQALLCSLWTSAAARCRGWEYFWFLDGWSIDFNFDGFYAWDDLRPAGAGTAVDRGAQLQRYANDTHEDHWIRG